MDTLGQLSTNGTDVLDRARAVSARLMARGASAEAAGRLPQETIDEVIAADIMRLVVPARYGGLEVAYPVIPHVSRLLGRGCLATSWTVGICLQHNLQLGFWPRAAQDEFWGKGPSVFAPGFIVPGGTATKVDGGWRLCGHWRFGSGYPHGDWILLGAFEVDDAGAKGPLRRFALPVAETTPVDNWQMAGMRASGTWDCTLDGVVVPEHRSFPAHKMMDGTAPGLADNRGPLWRIPLITFYYPNMAAMMLGAAEGVASLVIEATKKRVVSYGGAKAAELATTQTRIGAAMAHLNAAAALLDHETARIWDTAVANTSFTDEDRARVRANCTWITKAARTVASDLIDYAGTGSFHQNNPLQRFHREINVLASHQFYDWDRMAGVYGRSLLGQSIPPGELV